MKTILLLTTVSMLCFSMTTFCQNTNDVTRNKMFHEQKSKRQLLRGTIFTGVGVGLFALTTTNDQDIDDIGTNALLIGAGSAATIVGGVNIVSSFVNRSKAKKATAFIRVDKLPVARNTNYTVVRYPSVGIRVNL